MEKIMQKKVSNLRIIPLGGLGEVGRNMAVLEYEKHLLIIDVGFRMPEEDMPGIDFIIPNISFFKGKEKNILGAVITHGHYDHIGAIPYIMHKIGNPPIFASPLTKGIIMKRQDDFSGLPKLEIQEVKDGSRITLGPFQVEFFRQNHNIPDNLGLFIKTPVGNIIDTSDFKFDTNPVNEPPTNFEKLKQMGDRGVLLLMSDSTGAENEGRSLSESTIAENLEEIFRKNPNSRIFGVTFASLINRLQQMITISEKYGRKVVVEGYSMKTNVEIAKELGYLKAKKGTFIKSGEADRLPDSKVTVLCTGAQGEGQAVLMRIINQEHQSLRLRKGDLVILSSSVIPGNERTVQMLKDNILRQGAKVFHYKMMDIHASGHAQADELKELINMIKPKFFMPIHGQYSMLVSHGEIAKSCGVPEENVLIPENGQVISINDKKAVIEKKMIPSNYVMVDGLGVGDVGEIVLRDRQVLSKDGMFVIIAVIDRRTGKVKGSPDIISRGFVYLRESKKLLADTRKKVIEIINKATGSGRAVNLTYVKDEIRNKIGSYLFSKTERRPMVLPVLIEV